MAEVRGAIVGIAMAAVLAAATAGDAERVVQLDPDNDLIGQQIYAVQTYTPTAGGSPILDIGLYDTGASVISFSAYSNPYFPQPHLNPGGAGGQGVGGSVVGDVSQPGSILAGGILDFLFDFNLETFELSFGTLTDKARAVPGIQVFVGTEDGSPSLPSLTGTPIHKPSAAFPAGSAAHVTMQGAAGATITLPGFTLGGIDLAAAIDGGDFDDTLAFRDVPVFVYDLGIPGLDGIVGMNLFNGADEMLIDLIADELSVTFLANPGVASGSPADAFTAFFGTQFTGFAGHIAPAVGLGAIEPVPEPATLASLATAAALAALRRWAQRARTVRCMHEKH